MPTLELCPKKQALRNKDAKDAFTKIHLDDFAGGLASFILQYQDQVIAAIIVDANKDKRFKKKMRTALETIFTPKKISPSDGAKLLRVHHFAQVKFVHSFWICCIIPHRA